MPILVNIYEDNKNLLKSLDLLFKTTTDVVVTGTYTNCLHVVENTKNNKPNVIIMDINMPGINGVEGVKLCKKVYPEVLIIMFTVFDDDKKIFDALCAGANGYLLKNTKPQQLIAAVKDVYAGGAPLSPTIAKKVLQSFDKNSTKITFNLTSREIELLRLLSNGNTYKQIAELLSISIDTVRKHLQNIYTKLHVNCGSQAVAIALRNNIIQ